MRRVLFVSGGLLLAMAWASQAYAAPAWHGEAGVPSNVDLASVAAFPTAGGDDVVVAVGRDTSLKEAVIYRRVRGVWQQDPIYDSLNGIAPDSCLLSVSVSRDVAWAVGSQGGGCTSAPTGSSKELVVVFPAGGGALVTRGSTAGSNAWHFVTPKTSLGPLNSVSVSGSSGYVGTKTGSIYQISGWDQTPVQVTGSPSTASVNGVTAYGADAYAVGESSPSGVHIFKLTGADHSSAAAPGPTTLPPAGIAALGPTQGIAIAPGPCGTDATAPCYWSAEQGGAWAAEPSSNFGQATHLNAVSMASSGSSQVEAVAGDVTGQATVWTRSGTSPGTAWTQSSALGASMLRGLAALAPFDVWAVGDGGTVLHYVYDPDTVPPPNPGSPPPPPKQTSTGGSPPPSKPAPAPGPPPHVTVIQPPPKRTRGHKGHRKATQLVSHVHVKVDVGRLIVTFRLSAPARIQIEGRTKGRVVASAGPRVMRKGRARMVLTYRGARPPAQLRIIARPAKKAKP